MKRRAWPRDAACGHWRNEAAEFLAQAQERYRPSMAQVLDLDAAVRRAASRLRGLRYDAAPERLPGCGAIPIAALADPDVTLDDLDAALFPPG